MTNPRLHGMPGTRQRGLALLVALIVLVAMSLAGVALIRSVDTTSIVASNMAFRQTASMSNDAGVESARTWLLGQTPSSLGSDNAAQGYYATSLDTADLTSSVTSATTDDVKWLSHDGTAQPGSYDPKCLAPDAANNRVCFIINRMCSGSGALAQGSCATADMVASGRSAGAHGRETGYRPGGPDVTAFGGYYRITVRTAGPRKNLSYAQTFVIIANEI
jgi:Tfp pilus assembly protein PilX